MSNETKRDIAERLLTVLSVSGAGVDVPLPSNETKWDVFEDTVFQAGKSLYTLHDADYAEGILDRLRARYANALPDDTPVIPEVVGCMITKMKPICNSILASQYRDYGKDHRWIIDHYDTFARAWVLGVWRIEETGEIVKLEEEK